MASRQFRLLRSLVIRLLKLCQRFRVKSVRSILLEMVMLLQMLLINLAIKGLSMLIYHLIKCMTFCLKEMVADQMFLLI